MKKKDQENERQREKGNKPRSNVTKLVGDAVWVTYLDGPCRLKCRGPSARGSETSSVNHTIPSASSSRHGLDSGHDGYSRWQRAERDGKCASNAHSGVEREKKLLGLAPLGNHSCETASGDDVLPGGGRPPYSYETRSSAASGDSRRKKGLARHAPESDCKCKSETM
jgi:hypothetical protein